MWCSPLTSNLVLPRRQRKFPNWGWFGKMEAGSANNLLKQETGRNHDLRYRNSALAARARYITRKPFRLAVPLYTDFDWTWDESLAGLSSRLPMNFLIR
jgi:hypothetical protein